MEAHLSPNLQHKRINAACCIHLAIKLLLVRDYKKLKCVSILNSQHDRALPNYIYNERDPSSKNYGGRKIDWFNWNEYYPGFACRCARKAKHLGYDLFGLQFYGKFLTNDLRPFQLAFFIVYASHHNSF